MSQQDTQQLQPGDLGAGRTPAQICVDQRPTNLGIAYRVLPNTDDAWDAVGKGETKFIEKMGETRVPKNDEARACALLAKMVHDEAVDIVRCNQRRQANDRKFVLPVANAEPTVDQDDYLEHVTPKVREAVQMLSDKKSIIVVLHIWHGYTFVEIGEILHIPPDTAKSRWQRVLPILRDLLANVE